MNMLLIGHILFILLEGMGIPILEFGSTNSMLAVPKNCSITF